MSHFIALAIVPNGTPIEEFMPRLNSLLAPFNENTEVPEYQQECYCVGQAAKSAAREHAIATIGSTIADLRDKFNAQPETQQMRQTQSSLWDISKPSEEEEAELEHIEEQLNTAWREILAPWVEVEQSYLDAHANQLTLPDPACEECNGTGTHPSTYNPLSKWDWWVVGGRWDGWVQGEDHNDGADWRRVYSDAAHELRNNVARAEALMKQIHAGTHGTPFAIITPDSKWHEKGQMGWFATVSNKKEAKPWREEVVDLLAQHKQDWVVGCDLHI